MISIDVIKLLRFYDLKSSENGPDASAITGVAGEELGIALTVHHFRRHGLSAKTIPGKCTLGTIKGKRLDGWIDVERNGQKTLYQVEVKNWSAHSKGGEELAIDAAPQVVKAYKIKFWNKEWDGDGRRFQEDSVQKVLTRMKPPDSYAYDEIEPLVCFWAALHPYGAAECLFSVDVKAPPFTRVSVFSMSAYLRSLLEDKEPNICLELPGVKRRLQILDSLFLRRN